MTRPMPGPPKCDPTAWPHVTGTDAYRRGWCHVHAKGAYGPDKHLTDAECAAEYWRAGWIADHDFHDEHEADEASTWHRFATHPHALEGDNT